jgi:hypothetical protein
MRLSFHKTATNKTNFDMKPFEYNSVKYDMVGTEWVRDMVTKRQVILDRKLYEK